MITDSFGKPIHKGSQLAIATRSGSNAYFYGADVLDVESYDYTFNHILRNGDGTFKLDAAGEIQLIPETVQYAKLRVRVHSSGREQTIDMGNGYHNRVVVVG